MTRPSDEIWGLVCGFAEPKRSRRLLMMLKAYIDDSNMGVGLGPVAVLAGWLAPAKTWAAFVGDWQQVLDMKPKIDFFKWSDYRSGTGPFNGISGPMATEKLNLLINVLEDHRPLGVASVMSNDLQPNLWRKPRPDHARAVFSIVLFHSGPNG